MTYRDNAQVKFMWSEGWMVKTYLAPPAGVNLVLKLNRVNAFLAYRRMFARVLHLTRTPGLAGLKIYLLELQKVTKTISLSPCT